MKEKQVSKGINSAELLKNIQIEVRKIEIPRIEINLGNFVLSQRSSVLNLEKSEADKIATKYQFFQQTEEFKKENALRGTEGNVSPNTKQVMSEIMNRAENSTQIDIELKKPYFK